MPALAAPHSDDSPSRLPRAEVVTTTLFTRPTLTPPRPAPLPVPAIAGGAVAGVALAILAVVAWKLWGRSIEREQIQARQKRAAKAYQKSIASGGKDSQLTSTPSHTARTSTSSPKATPTPSARSSRDLTRDKANGHLVRAAPVPSAPRPLKPSEATKAVPQRPAHIRSGSTGSRTYTPDRPSPLSYGLTRSKSKKHSTSEPVPPVPALPPMAQVASGKKPASAPDAPAASSLSAEPSLAHKPPSMSSGSYYSVQSGELRRPRGKNSLTSVLSSARRMSNVTRSSGSEYSSSYSTADEHPWRWSWRLAFDRRNQLGRSRLSATTSSSGGSRPEDVPGVPIGLACGGEDELRAIAENEQTHDLEAGATLDCPREYLDLGETPQHPRQ